MPRTSERFSGRTVRYSPRNGTMRGSASPSTQRETRSACSPAQTTSLSTRMRLAPGHDEDAAGHPPDRGDRRRQPYVGPAGPQLARHRLGDGGVVGDRGGRRVQGDESGRMRFELADLARPDAAQARHAVLPGRPLERVQATDLVGVDGDDQLAAGVEGQPVLGAVVLEQPPAAGAQLGLEAARPVVDAGVHDPRVVAGLVGADARLLLPDHDGAVRAPPGELARHGQAHDAGAHDPEGLPHPTDCSEAGQRSASTGKPCWMPQATACAREETPTLRYVERM